MTRKTPIRRDALLKEIVTKYADKSPKTVAICQLLVETVLDPNGKKPLDVAALDRLVESIPEDARGNFRFFAGWFLKNHGDAKTAKNYLANLFAIAADRSSGTVTSPTRRSSVFPATESEHYAWMGTFMTSPWGKSFKAAVVFSIVFALCGFLVVASLGGGPPGPEETRLQCGALQSPAPADSSRPS